MSRTIQSLALSAAAAAADKKAKDIVVLDIHELTPMADFFVLASANSGTQVEAVARAVEDKLDELGCRCRAREGLGESRWVLLDFGDVVVHIFRPEDRDFYNLERLWGDAVRVPFEAPEL
ncbi:MAG: ribosome silencing factor [Alicyclobacillus sp.]|nr:ribosome silencing factor [Alicyclobacillus sp.]